MVKVIAIFAVGALVLGAAAWKAGEDPVTAQEDSAAVETIMRRIDIECRMYRNQRTPNRQMEEMCYDPAAYRDMARELISSCREYYERSREIAALPREQRESRMLEILEISGGLLVCSNMGVVR